VKLFRLKWSKVQRPLENYHIWGAKGKSGFQPQLHFEKARVRCESFIKDLIVRKGYGVFFELILFVSILLGITHKFL